ncbi:hypothetical protein PENTCL1PPCAC_26989, partial [Pristionchus entomophagus]
QLLTEAVNTLGYGEPDDLPTFCTTLRELGGLHRAIVPKLNPEAFTLIFAILPEVIVDVTSHRCKTGPLSTEDRNELISIWRTVTRFMANQVMTGWERLKFPTATSKYLKSYNERCPHSVSSAAVCTSPNPALPGFVPDNYRPVSSQ